MKLNLVQQVTPPTNTTILCAWEDMPTPLYFIGLFDGTHWNTSEYGVWELCEAPQYWCYLPTID